MSGDLIAFGVEGLEMPSYNVLITCKTSMTVTYRTTSFDCQDSFIHRLNTVLQFIDDFRELGLCVTVRMMPVMSSHTIVFCVTMALVVRRVRLVPPWRTRRELEASGSNRRSLSQVCLLARRIALRNTRE